MILSFTSKALFSLLIVASGIKLAVNQQQQQQPLPLPFLLPRGIFDLRKVTAKDALYMNLLAQSAYEYGSRTEQQLIRDAIRARYAPPELFSQRPDPFGFYHYYPPQFPLTHINPVYLPHPEHVLAQLPDPEELDGGLPEPPRVEEDDEQKSAEDNIGEDSEYGTEYETGQGYESQVEPEHDTSDLKLPQPNSNLAAQESFKMVTSSPLLPVKVTAEQQSSLTPEEIEMFEDILSQIEGGEPLPKSTSVSAVQPDSFFRPLTNGPATGLPRVGAVKMHSILQVPTNKGSAIKIEPSDTLDDVILRLATFETPETKTDRKPSNISRQIGPFSSHRTLGRPWRHDVDGQGYKLEEFIALHSTPNFPGSKFSGLPLLPPPISDTTIGKPHPNNLFFQQNLATNSAAEAQRHKTRQSRIKLPRRPPTSHSGYSPGQHKNLTLLQQTLRGPSSPSLPNGPHSKQYRKGHSMHS